MTESLLTYENHLQVHYQRVALALHVAEGHTAVYDVQRDVLLPVQCVPALPFDNTADETVTLVCVDLDPTETLELMATDKSSAAATSIIVTYDNDLLHIRNGRYAVRVPADGLLEQPFPGPICGMQIDGGAWLGESLLIDTPVRGFVRTQIESLGPCCVQWRTEYRWGNDASLTVRARWMSGSDTLMVVEEISESCDAAVEWYPFGETPAAGWIGGARKQAAKLLQYPAAQESRRGHGRRLVQHLSHISYFGQWNLPWIGFTGDRNVFLGLFTGWGSLWEQRGSVRPEIYEDDERGMLLRFPMKAGRRLFGIVFDDADTASPGTPTSRVNERKTALADLALQKVCLWELDGAVEERRPQLIHTEDLAGFRHRIAGQPACATILDEASKRGGMVSVEFALSLWQNDRERMRGVVPHILRYCQQLMQDLGIGGYERLGIFEGRSAKHFAYEFDLLWALDLLDEATCREIRRLFCALAYMYADPDFCRYEDFWPLRDPTSGMAQALKDEVGDCPVPPNFASEFFTTTGVMAELFPAHPCSDAWRQWTIAQTEAFLDTYFTDDGCYLESLNYHVHMFNELLAYLYPLAQHGGVDFFQHPRVRASFAHLARIQMPALDMRRYGAEGAYVKDSWDRLVMLLADGEASRRSMLPANGNSGGEGFEQWHGGEFSVGAAVYQHSDPEFSAELLAAWERIGRPVLDVVHPVLTLLTLHPEFPASTLQDHQSNWRRSLGVVSRATQADDMPLYCLFRAGNATHHMDYDQGNVHLAAGDQVLLGEYGYHAHDSQGNKLVCHETWLHNTVVYAGDKHLSSGYTGLERAPEPALVQLNEVYDWAVHRIVNTNYRDVRRFWYTVMLPTPTTVHVRHYLFVKPDYFLLWDVFEQAHAPALLYLHPREPLQREADGRYRAGAVGVPHLVVQFLAPETPKVVEDEQVGALWSFGVLLQPGEPCMTLLAPQRHERNIRAEFDADARVVRVRGDRINDCITLPPPGSHELLPLIERNG